MVSYSLAEIRVFSNKPSLILITCLHTRYVTLNGRQQANISWPLNPKPEDLTQVEKFTLLQKPIAHALFHYRKTLLYLPCLSSFMYVWDNSKSCSQMHINNVWKHHHDTHTPQSTDKTAKQHLLPLSNFPLSEQTKRPSAL